MKRMRGPMLRGLPQDVKYVARVMMKTRGLTLVATRGFNASPGPLAVPPASSP